MTFFIIISARASLTKLVDGFESGIHPPANVPPWRLFAPYVCTRVEEHEHGVWRSSNTEGEFLSGLVRVTLELQTPIACASSLLENVADCACVLCLRVVSLKTNLVILNVTDTSPYTVGVFYRQGLRFRDIGEKCAEFGDLPTQRPFEKSSSILGVVERVLLPRPGEWGSPCLVIACYVSAFGRNRLEYIQQ